MSAEKRVNTTNGCTPVETLIAEPFLSHRMKLQSLSTHSRFLLPAEPSVRIAYCHVNFNLDRDKTNVFNRNSLPLSSVTTQCHFLSNVFFNGFIYSYLLLSRTCRNPFNYQLHFNGSLKCFHDARIQPVMLTVQLVSKCVTCGPNTT